MKKLRFLIQLWDGIWSVPIAFSLFIFIAILGQKIFGSGVGFYDPAFWQAALLAAGELIFFNLIVFLGLYFNFRHIWKYYKGEKNENQLINKSKEDFNNIKPWQRLVLLLFLYCFYTLILVTLYKVHV
ncbi:hypothetical protein [Aquimarina sp. AU474]|uniref:hypothetical protein n=1 Tax=Aquimarina sp. AU474 TaxID=2108529 RepID=UPI000D686EF0|nr:hypothetical protein [Aquimarina sp. AU474]